MKVLNLRCANGHVFEGWFASEEDFMAQNGRSLIGCPICDDRQVARMPSAPRLNLSGAREPETVSVAAPAAPPSQAEMQAAWLTALQKVLRDTEDVGPRFPEEARRIHYGEAAERGIRGQASPAERAALADEGIEVTPLPLPVGMKGPAH